MMKTRSVFALSALLLSSVALSAPMEDRQKYEAWLSEFKQADLNYSGGLSQSELDKTKNFPLIKKRFKDMDANRDGQVTPLEYGQFIDARRKRVEALFNQVDTNKSGGLSKVELGKTPAKQFPNVKKNFDAMDANRDGQITLAERDNFKPAPKPTHKAAPAQDWQSAFKKADLNDSGGLSEVELKGVPAGTLDDLKKGFKEADANRDGQVALAEYQAFQEEDEEEEEDTSVMSFLQNLLGK